MRVGASFGERHSSVRSTLRLRTALFNGDLAGLEVFGGLQVVGQGSPRARVATTRSASTVAGPAATRQRERSGASTIRWPGAVVAKFHGGRRLRGSHHEKRWELRMRTPSPGGIIHEDERSSIGFLKENQIGGHSPFRAQVGVRPKAVALRCRWCALSLGSRRELRDTSSILTGAPGHLSSGRVDAILAVRPRAHHEPRERATAT